MRNEWVIVEKGTEVTADTTVGVDGKLYFGNLEKENIEAAGKDVKDIAEAVDLFKKKLSKEPKE